MREVYIEGIKINGMFVKMLRSPDDIAIKKAILIEN